MLASASACTLQLIHLIIPGPQMRGTGGTLNFDLDTMGALGGRTNCDIAEINF